MRFAALLLLFTACTADTPRVEGKVVDIWGHPVEGASVIVLGQTERPMTDSHGIFRVPAEPGTWEIKAGREGYIPAASTFEIVDATSKAPTLQLYEKPEENGFYVLSGQNYAQAQPQPVVAKGTALAGHRGIEEVGTAQADGPALRVLFHTDLREDEINRLGLELVKLDYVRDAPVSGALGPSEVKINLYVAREQVAFELEPLRSRTDYLITVPELKPGVYSFHSGEMLDDMSQEAFAQTPQELRLAWPFAVR
jgi:hypothetical protein